MGWGDKSALESVNAFNAPAQPFIQQISPKPCMTKPFMTAIAPIVNLIIQQMNKIRINARQGLITGGALI